MDPTKNIHVAMWDNGINHFRMKHVHQIRYNILANQKPW